MNHFEIRALFEKKINEARQAIQNAKNGDMLSSRVTISYINDSLVEKQDYNGRDNTSIVASAIFFEKYHESDEEPSYEISLLCDLKNGVAKYPQDFAKELENFDAELERFLKELSSCDDVYEFIKKEDERISLQGEKMVASMQKTLAKMKKAGIIGVIVLLGVLLAFTLLK